MTTVVGRVPTVAHRYAVTRRELRGPAAQKWFATHGWEFVEPVDGGFHAFIDEVTLLSTTVTRVWHTPASLMWSSPLPPGECESVALLQVHGTSALTLPTRISPPGGGGISA